MAELTKVCSKCGKELPHVAFFKRKTGRDGLCSWCKDCEKKRRSDWIQKNPLKQKEIARRHRVLNKATRYAETAEWRKLHPEKVKKYNTDKRDFYRANRDLVLSKSKEWRSENKDKCKSIAKAVWAALPVRMVANNLVRRTGLKWNEIPLELIEAKREQLKTYRATKQLISTLKEVSNHGTK